MVMRRKGMVREIVMVMMKKIRLELHIVLMSTLFYPIFSDQFDLSER